MKLKRLKASVRKRARRVWQKFLADSYRLFGREFLLVVYCKNFSILLSPLEMHAIGSLLRRRSGKLLVFGAGNDSILWTRLNRRGTTVFLENDSYWLKEIAAQAKWLVIYPVTYTTRVSEYGDILHSGERLEMALPPSVAGQTWDVILVDAPQGWGEGPGRMQSIYAASRLISPSGTIFVHDCDRPAEKLYTETYLSDYDRRQISPRLFQFENTAIP